MTMKLMKIFALVMACMMVLFISAAAYADEVPAKAETAEEEILEPEEAETEGVEEFDDDDLVEIDDDWGYVSPEVIEQHTPEMTQEFIHADDPDWQPKEETAATPEPVAEPAPEVQETVEEPAENKAAESTETPADVTDEDKAESVDVTENQAEDQAEEETKEENAEPGEEENVESTEEENFESTEEENVEPTEEENVEPTEEENTEEASKVTVKVTASMRSDNLMHLKAVVDDPEGHEYEYQWQVSVDGGENYEDCEDQTEEFMDVELDEENASNIWRVRVHAV